MHWCCTCQRAPVRRCNDFGSGARQRGKPSFSLHRLVPSRGVLCRHGSGDFKLASGSECCGNRDARTPGG
jgi:hypothetical protein